MEKILPYKIGDKIGDREVIDIIKIRTNKCYKLKCKCGKEINKQFSKIKSKCKSCQVKSFEGTKQGKLTFLKHMGNSKYEARCDCGITKIVNKSCMSCGCGQYRGITRALDFLERKKEMIGLKNCKLKIIGVKLIRNNSFLECICKCGNKKFYSTKYFYQNKSCGCGKYENRTGDNNSRTKFNISKILELKELYFSGMYSIKELCKIFNIRNSSVYQILREEIWKNAKIDKSIKKFSIPKRYRKIYTIEELEGKTFGNQTILEILDKGKITSNSLALVKCHCGNIRKIKLCTVIHDRSSCCNKCRPRAKKA